MPTVIWFIQNIHVYADFHAATKFIYKIAEQTIIMRSVNCCLHFNDRWFSNVDWIVDDSKCDMLYDKFCTASKGLVECENTTSKRADS